MKRGRPPKDEWLKTVEATWLTLIHRSKPNNTVAGVATELEREHQRIVTDRQRLKREGMPLATGEVLAAQLLKKGAISEAEYKMIAKGTVLKTRSVNTVRKALQRFRRNGQE
jgi:hypothetical protein